MKSLFNRVVSRRLVKSRTSALHRAAFEALEQRKLFWAAVPTDFQLVETLSIPLNGSDVTTANVLTNGRQYHLVASGQVRVGTGLTADAEYIDNGSSVDDASSGTVIDYGISIGGGTAGALKSQSWGSFQSDGVYAVSRAGSGSALSFSFWDNNYGDNPALDLNDPGTYLTVQVFGQIAGQGTLPAVPGSGEGVTGEGTGVGSGENATPRSITGVRYSDGSVAWQSTDFESSGFGVLWGHTRTYSSLLRFTDPAAQGNGWQLTFMPRLEVVDGDTIAVNFNGVSAETFDYDAAVGGYVARHYDTSTLTHDTVNDEYVYTDMLGQQTQFTDFTHATTGRRGKFVSFADAGGLTIAATSWNGAGDATAVERVSAAGAKNVFEYTYDGSGRLESVAYKVQTNSSGSLALVRTASFDYYGSSDANGPEGALRRVQVKDPSNAVIDTKYYRYWKDSAGGIGIAGGLKFVLEARGYARLANSTDPLTASDATLDDYADRYFEYDSQGRVTKAVVKGDGSSSGTGLGTYTYSYLTSSHSSAYNHWKYKTVETEPDGGTTTVYSNDVGQAIALVRQGNGDSRKWINYWQYDNQGRVVLSAQPSAVSGLDEGTATLLDRNSTTGLFQYLRDDEGLVAGYEYSRATAATTTVAGAVFGYLRSTSLVRGEAGTPVKQSATDYIRRNAAAATTFPVASSSVFRNTDGTGEQKTSYAYEWTGTTFRFSQQVTTRPIVTTLQNGPGTADIETTRFDEYGRQRWFRDGEGFISFTAYDVATGGLTEEITDVNTDTFSESSLERTVSSVAITATGASYTTITLTLASHGLRAGDWIRLTGASPSQYNGTFYVESVPTSGTLTYLVPNASAPGSSPATGTVQLGWGSPYDRGLHLDVDYGVDGLGRQVWMADAMANAAVSNDRLTYTVYLDSAHERRVYPGWNTSALKPTGPTQVWRDDRARGYVEELTISATPSLNGSSQPTGGESISGLQSLSRSYYSSADQLSYRDSYFSFTSLSYSTSTSLGTLNTHFYRENYGYDVEGRRDRVAQGTGTITRLIYDGLGRTSEQWVGTDDTPTSGQWSPSNTGGTNLTKVETHEYDGGNVGDGNRTKLTKIRGLSQADDVILGAYDWRNRLAWTKVGTETSESESVNRPISYRVFDNLGQITRRDQYDGDTVIPTDSNSDGIPDAPSASRLVARTESSFDERGRVYLGVVYGVSPSDGSVSSRGLETNTYFDRRGLPLAVRAPGAPAEEYFYDGAGRLVITDYTDGGGGTTWDDARTSTDDRVIQRVLNTYDANGNVILETTYRRFHNADEFWIDYYASSGGAYQFTKSIVDSTRPAGTDTSYNRLYVPMTGEPGDREGKIGGQGGYAPSRVSHKAYYYDFSNRPIAEVDVGTNGGSSYTRPVTAPLPTDRSDTVLITSTSYDSAGRVYDVTDPRGIVDRNTYDALGRRTRLIESYANGTMETSDSRQDDDRITDWTYDASDHILTMKAQLPSSAFQTTQYVYAATTGGGHGINSNDLLTAIYYPDLSSGNPNSTTQDERFTVDAQGRRKAYEDRNGNVHTYTYDTVGRQTIDAVTTLGSNVDDYVRRIERSYDKAGLEYEITSYSASSGGVVRNQIRRLYNGWQQLTQEFQAVTGSVVTGTPSVRYQYAETDGSHGYSSYSFINNSILYRTIYPNGRAIYTGTNSIGQPGGGSNGAAISPYDGELFENVDYVGLDLPVRVVRDNYTFPLFFDYLNYSTSVDKLTLSATSDSQDFYGGYDRFNRTVSIDWGWGADESNVDGPSVALGEWRERLTYGYDRGGNRLYEDNLLNTAFGELYSANEGGYDDLDRLTGFRRGVLSDTDADGLMEVATSPRTQAWTLDALGNWSTIVNTTGTAPVVTTTTNRTHNRQNQWSYTVLGAGPTYDTNGNLLVHSSVGSTAPQRKYVYDAWNRAMRVVPAGVIPPNALTVEYTYDGKNRRVSREAYGGEIAETILYFYSDSWQVLEERRIDGSAVLPESRQANQSKYTSPADPEDLPEFDGDLSQEEQNTLYLTMLNFNANEESLAGGGLGGGGASAMSSSPGTYIDGVTGDAIPDSAYQQYVWSGLYVDELILRDRDSDANAATGELGIGVAALGWTSGQTTGLQERVFTVTDANHNITATLINEDVEYTVHERYMYDPYGKVTVLNADWTTKTAGTSIAWEHYHQGGRLDSYSGLYHFRNRDYSPTMGRWTRQDPLGYVDGGSLYQAYKGSPIDTLDTLGLQVITDPGIRAQDGGPPCNGCKGRYQQRAAAAQAALANGSAGMGAAGAGTVVGAGTLIWGVAASGPIGWVTGAFAVVGSIGIGLGLRKQTQG
jgi:RHS repeat-associated protein